MKVKNPVSQIIIIYTGAGHIIWISSKSWFISLIPFKKWNLYNIYIHSTQTDIFQVFIYFNFDDYNWQLMKTPNSDHPYSINSGYTLLFETTIIGNTADVAMVQKTIIDTLHKEGKSQKVIS